ncbi:hypothetical protein TetV_258 [Tetraselmis virus 1]|uniref:EF-hand domain-containing protein n=1 Tax=Tetraselmis virus 1 TaxID=2060617 RepID=A0A2P0VN98_9VIRU|nr:hypothetical protein QJ968_gp258 [Tetraselmis virus 1]AUF82350.1 hypothetical protein TetV_258 [Tetraselmis virus 1]
MAEAASLVIAAGMIALQHFLNSKEGKTYKRSGGIDIKKYITDNAPDLKSVPLVNSIDLNSTKGNIATSEAVAQVSQEVNRMMDVIKQVFDIDGDKELTQAEVDKFIGIVNILKENGAFLSTPQELKKALDVWKINNGISEDDKSLKDKLEKSNQVVSKIKAELEALKGTLGLGTDPEELERIKDCCKDLDELKAKYTQGIVGGDPSKVTKDDLKDALGELRKIQNEMAVGMDPSPSPETITADPVVAVVKDHREASKKVPKGKTLSEVLDDYNDLRALNEDLMRQLREILKAGDDTEKDELIAKLRALLKECEGKGVIGLSDEDKDSLKDALGEDYDENDPLLSAMQKLIKKYVALKKRCEGLVPKEDEESTTDPEKLAGDKNDLDKLNALLGEISDLKGLVAKLEAIRDALKAKLRKRKGDGEEDEEGEEDKPLEEIVKDLCDCDEEEDEESTTDPEKLTGDKNDLDKLNALLGEISDLKGLVAKLEAIRDALKAKLRKRKGDGEGDGEEGEGDGEEGEGDREEDEGDGEEDEEDKPLEEIVKELCDCEEDEESTTDPEKLTGDKNDLDRVNALLGEISDLKGLVAKLEAIRDAMKAKLRKRKGEEGKGEEGEGEEGEGEESESEEGEDKTLEELVTELENCDKYIQELEDLKRKLESLTGKEDKDEAIQAIEDFSKDLNLIRNTAINGLNDNSEEKIDDSIETTELVAKMKAFFLALDGKVDPSNLQNRLSALEAEIESLGGMDKLKSIPDWIFEILPTLKSDVQFQSIEGLNGLLKCCKDLQEIIDQLPPDSSDSSSPVLRVQSLKEELEKCREELKRLMNMLGISNVEEESQLGDLANLHKLLKEYTIENQQLKDLLDAINKAKTEFNIDNVSVIDSFEAIINALRECREKLEELKLNNIKYESSEKSLKDTFGENFMDVIMFLKNSFVLYHEFITNASEDKLDFKDDQKLKFVHLVLSKLSAIPTRSTAGANGLNKESQEKYDLIRFTDDNINKVIVTTTQVFTDYLNSENLKQKCEYELKTCRDTNSINTRTIEDLKEEIKNHLSEISKLKDDIQRLQAEMFVPKIEDPDSGFGSVLESGSKMEIKISDPRLYDNPNFQQLLNFFYDICADTINTVTNTKKYTEIKEGEKIKEPLVNQVQTECRGVLLDLRKAINEYNERKKTNSSSIDIIQDCSIETVNNSELDLDKLDQIKQAVGEASGMFIKEIQVASKEYTDGKACDLLNKNVGSATSISGLLGLIKRYRDEIEKLKRNCSSVMLPKITESKSGNKDKLAEAIQVLYPSQREITNEFISQVILDLMNNKIASPDIDGLKLFTFGVSLYTQEMSKKIFKEIFLRCNKTPPKHLELNWSINNKYYKLVNKKDPKEIEGMSPVVFFKEANNDKLQGTYTALGEPEKYKGALYIDNTKKVQFIRQQYSQTIKDVNNSLQKLVEYGWNGLVKQENSGQFWFNDDISATLYEMSYSLNSSDIEYLYNNNTYPDPLLSITGLPEFIEQNKNVETLTNELDNLYQTVLNIKWQEKMNQNAKSADVLRQSIAELKNAKKPVLNRNTSALKRGGGGTDSPLVPVMALQMTRLCYFAYISSRRDINMGDLVRDAVYSVGVLMAIYSSGMMSERSVQIAVTAVLASWCISTLFWSAMMAKKKYSGVEGESPDERKRCCYMGVIVNAVVFAGTPLAIYKFL